jgi:large subunit ribosomal protein L25
METVELACEKRAIRPKGLINRLRHAGRVPAVLYGNHGAAMPIAVDGAELKARVSTAARQRIIRLRSDVSELNQKHVILKEVQRTPVSREILHADFYEVDLSKPIRVEVALRFVGRAAGIVDGGILQPLVRQVEVECLPLELPEAIDVDVTPLGIHDVIHISDVQFAGNVKPLYDSDYAVVTVLPPTVAEAPVAATPEEAEAAAAEAATPAAAAGEKGEKPAAEAAAQTPAGKKG